MLSDQEKREMLEDALSIERREEFLSTQHQKQHNIKTLDDYIAFLMAVQQIKPFQHQPVITKTSKNLL